MLRTDLPDHRRSDEPRLLAALRDRDPLALAEAYNRTVAAAHAVARRLLGAPLEVEALLRTVYAELWESPPEEGVALERWVRERCFAVGAAHLRERGVPPAAPSTARLLPDLPAPSSQRYLDTAERALAELPREQLDALIAAHDRGVPSGEQEPPGTGAALRDALLHLAGPDPIGQRVPEAQDDPAAIEGLADFVLGLLPATRAAELARTATARPGYAAFVQALRRGRRRLEGLPPTTDMGQRVVAAVVAGAAAGTDGRRGRRLRDEPQDGDHGDEPQGGDHGDEHDTQDLSSVGPGYETSADGNDDGARPRARRLRRVLTWVFVLVGALLGVYLGLILFTALR